ncbi:hypothetical protein ACE1ET_20285 [Saccharicrinis sp. FJH62]|uniref:hypothetical protein n=1 Tax=Saccharicrinis sp. FJH62 TaxID=3344657 RepID=UPI0035D45E87
MKKLILIISLISIGLNCIAQDIDLKKNELYKIFRKSINQPERNKVIIGNNPWIINNEDSAYYKRDTIYLYNINNHANNLNLCQTIDWTFYKKNALIICRSKHCYGPPANTFLTSRDLIKIKIEDNDELIIRLFNFSKLVDVFKVLEFEDIDGNLKLTLLRKKYKASS